MILKIDHTTEYLYSGDVFLGPHVLRLTPRFGPSQRIMEEGVSVDPKPAGRSRCLSPEGFTQDFVWFAGATDRLKITSSIVVSLAESNPYDFLMHPNECQVLPFSYGPGLDAVLAPALVPLSDSPVIAEIAEALVEYTGRRTLSVISYLMQDINKTFTYTHRADGAPKSPEETFRSKEGSCRDLVVFTMAVLRHIGIAARFVSGYYIENEDRPDPQLHAWVEVYLPGGGWRGFDPTCGVACFGRHIALSASSDPQMTLPVEGTFRGSAESIMNVEIAMEKVKDMSWYITA